MNASPASQERPLRAQPAMEVRSEGERGDRPRERAPKLVESWSARIPAAEARGKPTAGMRRKAAVLDA